MTVWKESADVATTEALGAGPAFPASGVIDGVILKVGNRVLVKDQLTSTQNGYYYKVFAGVPPTLMATGDTIEAEDVIRVNQATGMHTPHGRSSTRRIASSFDRMSNTTLSGPLTR